MNIVNECVLGDDFEKVCRICMKFDKTFLAINSFNIIEMITACASVQIWENDDLPNQICNECFLQLQNIINFKHLCENSDKAFRQIIGNKKTNLWNNKNGLCSVKNEEDNSLGLGFGNDNSTVYIKEEDNSNQNEYEETLEIKYEDKNRRETRRKTIQYKFEEDTDSSEDIKEQKDSDWESEVEKSDFEETQINELEFKCETCTATFKRLDSLGQHMQRKHNAEGTMCKKCSVICYHPLHLRAHEKLHNKCRICKLSFSTRKKLESHKVTHVHKRIPELTCKMCEKQFTSRTNLNKHLREIHKIETKPILKCETCNETFKTKQLLERHTRKMHPPKPKKINRSREIINCEVCGKMCQRRYLHAHMNIHGERNRIACEYCAKIFISQDTLQTHVKTYHIGSGPICRYLCTECGLKLRSKHQLKNHLITHTKERPFACDKCDKTYRTTCMLKVHISRTHLNERNFVCTFCSQAFFDKKILLNHVRRHTGEKPYSCDLCDKSFIQRVALQSHMKIHSV